jgi:hypothetical protein
MAFDSCFFCPGRLIDLVVFWWDYVFFDVKKNVLWHNLGVSSTWGRENTSLTPNTIPLLTPNTICSASRCQIEY